MDKPSVSRCVAVAAHGRRCRQSPFRGSPYCWHHTQSSKIPPPSRPLVSRATPVTRRGGGGFAAVELAAEPAVAEAIVDGARLLELLGPQAAAVLAFLEGWGDGALQLERCDGRLDARLVPATERRRAGGGASAL